MSTLQAQSRPQFEVTAKEGGLPPVVVLNMFYSGLGIARALAGKGVRVIGLSADPNAYGNYTRFCEVELAPSSKDRPEELLEFLLRRKKDFVGAVIFPTRDADVVLLDRYRKELTCVYRLAVPPARCLRRTIDKYSLALAAQEAGVPVPRTLHLSSPEKLGRVPREVGFPCVLKPISAFQWHMGDAWGRVGARKAVRVDTPEQLQDEYEQISKVTREVLVQEWIAGAVEQITVLGGYVNDDSELASYFTARKILQSPDDCGTGCIVRSEPIPDIVEPTRRLLRTLRYQGMAEVEFKFDVVTREHKLIEINTRHWDQHGLGLASGVNLTWVAYCDLIGKCLPQEEKSTVHALWIAEDALVVRLLRSLSNCELRVPRLWNKLSSRRVYGVFSWRDPIPFVRYFFGNLLLRLGRAALVRTGSFWGR
jgi:predicted ATP-grasp superfamily ATP-dependent carboligase